MSGQSRTPTCGSSWRSWSRRGEAARDPLAAVCRPASAGRLKSPAGLLGRPPAARPAPGGQGRGTDGGAALPRLPGAIDRRFRRRACRRHARPGAAAHRRGGAAGQGSRLADPALRQLDQLPPDGRASRLAAVAAAAGAADRWRVPRHEAGEGAPMSGWLILLLLIAASLGLLRLFGVRGAMLQAAGAALLFGAAGYALQGHPGRAGVPAKGSATADAVALTGARQAFFGSFTRNQHWLVISEALARNGNSMDSVGILQSAVREHPDDPELWVGL